MKSFVYIFTFVYVKGTIYIQVADWLARIYAFMYLLMFAEIYT